MSSTAKLGAFTLAALVVVGFFILRIERIAVGGRAARQTVQAVFPSVAGLDEKSAVRVAGVRVGLVARIALQRDRALVVLEVDPAIKLHQGAGAAVRMLGMLGDLYVELDPGPPANPLLAAGTVLEGTSPTSWDRVLDTAGGVGGDIKAVTSSLRGSLGGVEGQQKIDEILANVRELTAGIRVMVDENRGAIAATLDNFRAFSQGLKDELPKLADKLDRLADNVDAIVQDNRENIAGALGNVREVTAQLRTSADNLNQITGKIARGEGSIGKLVNDSATVDNLNATLKSVESGVSTLRNTIGRAERWKLDVDLRAESLPRIHESRSSFGLDLSTTDQRFYRLGVVKAPTGATKDTTETITTTTPDGVSSTLTQKIARTSNDFSYNAQVGYRLGGTTLRAGLFESTGGFGVDQSLLGRKAFFTVDAFDFNRDEKPPHVRVEARYFFTRNLYAYAGFDDPRWSANRSVLVGGGVTWTDEDIKYLLGTASALGGR